MQLFIATNEEERQAIRCLRDEVNRQELGKMYLHESDSYLDNNSTLLYVKNDEVLVASLRCRFPFSDSDELRKWSLHSPARIKIAVTDRLVVAAAYRHSRAAYLLVTGIYRQALLEGAKLAFMECEEHLLPLYQKLGFEVYREVTYSYGKRFQLFLNPWDLNALQKAGSPFIRAYEQYMKEVNSFIDPLNAGKRA